MSDISIITPWMASHGPAVAASVREVAVVGIYIHSCFSHLFLYGEVKASHLVPPLFAYLH